MGKKQDFLPSVFKGRRCLVTGHTGFKGAWLCLWLKQLGAQVSGYALDPPSRPSLASLLRLRGMIEHDYWGDVRDYDYLEAVIKECQPEIVFHLAAQALVRISYDLPKLTFDINAGGTVNVLEALRDSDSVRAIVVVTTDKCYENRETLRPYRESDPLGGHDPYSASKAATEIVAASYRRSFFAPCGIGLATARAGNVIGGGDWAHERIIPDAVRALRAGRAVGVRNPDSVRPWQHVLEPLCGYLTLAARLWEEAGACQVQSGGAWNFGPPLASCVSVRKLIGMFLREYGKGKWEDLSKIGGAAAGAPHEAKLLSLAWDKAERELGWRPRWSLKEGIRRTSAWYRAFAKGAKVKKLCMDEIEAYMNVI
ncbi:MAG: CDP-glucose 4,6-dehydratase [Candidatus Sumerlaeota bacterium]|nr:CDP-glucose 4,6-dehydratase [Candidatus Sumerlaeota bacterium]